MKTKLDWLGIALVTFGASSALIWVSLGGKSESSGGFPWDSPTSWLLGGSSILLILGAIFWLLFGAKEPLIPLRFFRDRTFALSVVGSIPIGIAQFGAAVFLAQYMQLARGYSPTESGLMTFPMVIGSLTASILVGQLVSRTGVWKPYVVGGASIFVVGAFLLSTIHYNSDQWLVSGYMFLLGLGMGACMQNLVLVMQNSLPASNLSSGTGTLTFLRTLGGAAGVTVLGSVLAGALPNAIQNGVGKVMETPALQEEMANGGGACMASLESLKSGALPAVNSLCEPIKLVVENAYGDNIAGLFLPLAIAGIITIVAAIFLPNKPLSKKTAVEQIEEELGAEVSALHSPEDGGAPDTSSIPLPEKHKKRD